MSTATEHLPISSWVPRPFGPPWQRAWMVRHQHPFNFWIHMIGIPLTLLPIPLPLLDFFSLRQWLLMFGLIAFGFLIQFVGHLVEGNDMGELILVKRWLGWDYVSVVPREQN